MPSRDNSWVSLWTDYFCDDIEAITKCIKDLNNFWKNVIRDSDGLRNAKCISFNCGRFSENENIYYYLVHYYFLTYYLLWFVNTKRKKWKYILITVIII